MSAASTRLDTTEFWRVMVLFSPIVVVGLGYVVALITGAIWGLWAWVPVLICYWAVLGALIAWGGGREAIKRWLQPSQGRRLWMWRAVAVALPAIFLFGVFFQNLPRLIRNPVERLPKVTLSVLPDSLLPKRAVGERLPTTAEPM